MKFKFVHNNFNVKNLEKSIEFYKRALDLQVKREVKKEDGSFILTYLGNDENEFLLELTWLRDWDRPYNLGDNEFHLALEVDDYEAAKKLHSEMGCICFENKEMGIYFISDPDGYWIEIIPKHKNKK